MQGLFLKKMKTITLRHPFAPEHRPQIHAIVTDFLQFGAFHPLIKQVDSLAIDAIEDAIYDIKEEVVLFGWLKMKPQYRVFVEKSVEHDRVVYKSMIMGIMRLRIEFSFLQDEEQFWLIEKVQVSRIPLITKIFLDIFSPAHLATFAKIRQHLPELHV